MRTKTILFFFISLGLIILAISLFIFVAWIYPMQMVEPLDDPVSLAIRNAQPGSDIEIFNGNDLTGWSKVGLGKWEVKDGVIIYNGGLGYVATQWNLFENFDLTLQVRARAKSNSGVFFRAHHPGFGFRPWPVGYEAQIDNHDPINPTGSLYKRVKASAPPPPEGEWFDYKISTRQNHIRIEINQHTVVDATDTTFQKGFIALQAHDFSSSVEFKNIRIRIPAEQE